MPLTVYTPGSRADCSNRLTAACGSNILRLKEARNGRPRMFENLKERIADLRERTSVLGRSL